MTPTSSSISVNPIETGIVDNGDSRVQTINPKELTVWRIIKINVDGSIEMVSENVSSTAIDFYGEYGYEYFVEVLNKLAKGYENSAYTIGSRHMGYNGQSTSMGTPSATEDNLYQADTGLVNAALGTLTAKIPSGSSSKDYFIASRKYTGSTIYGVSYISGSSVASYMLVTPGYEDDFDAAIRPIVVLKPGVVIASGTGKSTSHWKLG